ncbi:MAG: hypothetical protein GC162_20850 [Planctomycetes bacterium]|nr:hypothetical protein [Planctomycetota bacterium]
MIQTTAQTGRNWFFIYTAIVLASIGLSVALLFSSLTSIDHWYWETTAGRWIDGVWGVLELAAAFIGLRRLRLADTGLSRTLGMWLGAIVILDGIDSMSGAFTGKLLSFTPIGRGIGCAVMLSLIFLAILGLVRWLLKFGSGAMGVARTVIDEAIRMKLAVVFMALMLVTVPIMPFLQSADNPLHYRVQTFLTYSMFVTGLLLSLMTIFLACATLSSEITDKQIFTVAVKPVRRGTYLLGKWLGIVLLNAVLVTVAGLAIYFFTVGYLANLPPQSASDAIALRDEVLVARVSAQPRPKVPLDDQAEKMLQQTLKENPQTVMQLGEQTAGELGLTGASPQKLMQWGATAAKNQYRADLDKQWLSVGPRDVQEYVFTGFKPVVDAWQRDVEAYKKKIEDAKAAGQTTIEPLARRFVQMRYKIKVSSTAGGDEVLMQVAYNGQVVPIKLVVNIAQTVNVPVDLIRPDGTLQIAWFNPLPTNPTVSFTPKDGFEVLYRAGDFGLNFVRAMISMWVKLAFLAMLGLMAATFLGFPVACMLSLLVYVAAAASPFLVDAVRGVSSKPDDTFGYIELGMKYIAQAVIAIVGRYADYRATPLVIDGRLFSWADTGGCVLWIGVVWTGMVGLIAWLIFQRRELARVQI